MQRQTSGRGDSSSCARIEGLLAMIKFSFVIRILNIAMFDSTPMSSDRNSPDLNVNQLRDGLASLTHRVG